MLNHQIILENKTVTTHQDKFGACTVRVLYREGVAAQDMKLYNSGTYRILSVDV